VKILKNFFRPLSFLYLFIIIPTLLVILSCSYTVKEKRIPEMKLSELVLAKSIKRIGTSAFPQLISKKFSNRDLEVIALVNLENLSGEHLLKFEWLSPEGKIYHSTKDFDIKVNDGKYRKKTSVWHNLPLRGQKTAKMTGVWQVKVYLDYALLSTENFTVEQGITNIEEVVPTPASPDSDKWAMVIGLENYKQMQKIDLALSDAKIMKRHFKQLFGVPEANTISINDQNVTKKNLDHYFKKYFPGKLTKNSTLYIYYAGHGMSDRKKKEKKYLIPDDVNLRYISLTSYSLKNFYKYLQKLPCKQIIVFLDTSFSDSMIKIKGMAPDSTKIITMAATNNQSLRLVNREKKHGLFTYFLLLGMRGEADIDDNQIITYKELYDFTSQETNKYALQHGNEQFIISIPEAGKVNLEMIKQ
jgi:hypothetical protein